MDKNSKSSLVTFFKDKFGIQLNSADLLEVQESMYYLGRATYRYELLKKQGKIKKNV